MVGALYEMLKKRTQINIGDRFQIYGLTFEITDRLGRDEYEATALPGGDLVEPIMSGTTFVMRSRYYQITRIRSKQRINFKISDPTQPAAKLNT